MSTSQQIFRIVKIGNNETIRVRSLKEYLKKRSTFIKLRLRFLIWEVDPEIAEIFSGYAVWAMLTDITNLIKSGERNQIYDVLFQIRPPLTWAIIAAVVAFMHLTVLLLDKSSEIDFDCRKPKALQYLFIRSRLMFVALILNSIVTLSVIVGHSYVLVWKYQILFVLASFLSYVRLNKQYKTFVDLKKKDEISAFSSSKD